MRPSYVFLYWNKYKSEFGPCKGGRKLHLTCFSLVKEPECPKRGLFGPRKCEALMQGARPLNPDELSRLLRRCQDVRDRCLIEIDTNLGLRVSELVTLKSRDLLHRGKVLPFLYLQRRLTKGRRSRSIPINDKAAKAIKRLHRYYGRMGKGLKPNDYLFPGRTEGHLSCRHVNRLLYGPFDRAGLSGRLSSHTFRKTFGTLLTNKGIQLPVIQELYGHADISTTRKYLGVGMENLENAVRVLAKAY